MKQREDPKILWLCNNDTTIKLRPRLTKYIALFWGSAFTSRKRHRTKVTSDFHLTYSKNGGNWGRNQNDIKWKNFDISP